LLVSVWEYIEAFLIGYHTAEIVTDCTG
jgi:hypothetical protein